MKYPADLYVWVAARFVMGFMFLWAFLDKLFGWNFATVPEKSWVMGGSPTTGFLKIAVTGPFSNFFHSLAGSAVVDWLFMLGLLGIGLALILGVGVKIAGWSGALMVLLMWLALLPPKNNPVIDEHIVELVVLIGLAVSQFKSGDLMGLGKWWRSKEIVRRNPILE